MSESEIQIEVFGKTDVGLIREHNEDNLLIADLGGGFKESSLDEPAKLTLGARGALFLVCDGMGGAAAGEVASQMAVDAVFDSMSSSEPQPHEPFARSLRHAVEVANDRIFQQSRDNQSERGMGTTCTAAALVDDTLMVAQIGDSRCYVFRSGNLGQVTKDQSLAWQLIEAGAMTAEDAKAFEHANIILQALGVQDRVDVVMSQITLRKGDVVLLCSDGLHGPVTDQEIRDILAADTDLKKAGEGLLQKALERDGPDNITVILARFDGAGLADPDPNDTVGFVSYDPGRDPVSASSDSSRSGTVAAMAAVTASARLVGETSAAVERAKRKSREMPSGSRSGGNAAKRDRRDDGPARDGRSVIALFFLVLVAVAVGSVSVLKCERDAASRSEGTARSP
ncbi:MAG TPA: Stp1/IreP family PP2C-type Ser/Thr phosphatase [Polyangia bacterium]|jgi:protein phosphatase